MTSASCASLTETSLNDLESSVHSATTTASGTRRRGKRKTRTSPSGSRAAQSDVTSQVDSADDAEDTAAHRGAHFADHHGDDDDDDDDRQAVKRANSVLKRTRRRRLNSSSGSESHERIGVLSIEESGESQSAAVSLPAPAVRNMTTSSDNVLRPALVRRPFAPRREDRHVGALDSAEDAEETENRVAAASVKNRDPAIDQSRRSVLRAGRRSSPGATTVPAFEPTFVRPAPRRRRVRIAEQTHVAPSTPLAAADESSRSSRARGGSGSHGGLHKDAIEAFQEHLAAELGAAAAAAENVGETDSN